MSKFPKLKNYYQHPLASIKSDFDNLFNALLDDEGNLLAKLTDYGNFLPKMNISETDKEYQLHFEIPGVEKPDLEVSLHQNMLTVKGEKKEDKTEDSKKFHRVESHYGIFFREVKLPENIDEKSLKANFKNGILTVSINKTSAPQNKRSIPISES